MQRVRWLQIIGVPKCWREDWLKDKQKSLTIFRKLEHERFGNEVGKSVLLVWIIDSQETAFNFREYLELVSNLDSSKRTYMWRRMNSAMHL